MPASLKSSSQAPSAKSCSVHCWAALTFSEDTETRSPPPSEGPSLSSGCRSSAATRKDILNVSSRPGRPERELKEPSDDLRRERYWCLRWTLGSRDISGNFATPPGHRAIEAAKRERTTRQAACARATHPCRLWVLPSPTAAVSVSSQLADCKLAQMCASCLDPSSDYRLVDQQRQPLSGGVFPGLILMSGGDWHPRSLQPRMCPWTPLLSTALHPPLLMT